MTENEINKAVDEIWLAQLALNEAIIDIIVGDVVAISKLDKSTVFDYHYNENEIRLLIEQRIRRIKTLSTNLLYNVALDVYKDAKAMYNARTIEQLAMLKNIEIADNLIGLEKQTHRAIDLVNKNGIILLGQNTSSLIPRKLETARKQITDIAKQAVFLGTDFIRTIRRPLMQLGDSGIRIAPYNNSKMTQKSEQVIERNSQYMARDAETQTSDIIGKQVMTDGVELSAHIMPAPDHAPAQGHQFSNADFEKMQSGMPFNDAQGRLYVGFERSIGTWNCRHTVKHIILGVSEQKISDRELQRILDENEKGKIINGKHYTLYECTQVQRRYEQQIRKAKSQWRIFNSVGDIQMANKYKTKYTQLTNEYMQFSKLCGISPKPERLKID